MMLLVQIITLFVLVCIFIWFFNTYVRKVIFGAPFVPTPKDKIRIALDMAKVDKDDIVIDLGSGNSSVLIEASLRGCRQAIGYEIDKKLVNISEERIRELNLKNISVYKKSFWQADLSKADVLFVFGVYHIMPFLKRKIFKEMKKGSRVVSYIFKFPFWKPVKCIDSIYLYIVD